MLLDLASCVLIFWGVTLGVGWPLASRLNLDPVEKVSASVVLSLLGIFLYGWVVYIFALPATTLRALPAFAALALIRGGRSLAATFRDANVRTLVLTQGMISAWCVGLLALVLTYSGGGWKADWWGHMQRTWLFLEHWPRTQLFNSFDALTSRPPLANIVNGAFLMMSERNFRHYQLFSTLFSSLAFLPAGLLAFRFGGIRTVTILAVLFMLNPLFAENATYTWTKLPTVFFVLSALYFFLRAQDQLAPPSAGILFSVSLACGILTHYSTGPYALFLASAWIILGWAHLHKKAWWRNTGFVALTGASILLVWFGWAIAVFGWRTTFFTNSSVTDKAATAREQLQVAALNIRDTFIPHFLRSPDSTLIAQSSLLGWWRDWFFNLYQTNFFFAFGSVTWVMLAIILVRIWSKTKATQRTFGMLFIFSTAILGVAVHGARDTWGLVHICLQPLVLLGLALLAGYWRLLERSWRLVLFTGLILDFLFGIVLQFWVESDGLNHAFDSVSVDPPTSLSQTSQMNLYAKLDNHWIFVGDIFAPYAIFVATLLGLLLLLAIIRARRNAVGLVPLINHESSAAR